MTQDEIIEMVMQIGGCDKPEHDSPPLKMFVAFAKIVTEKEREKCAELVATQARQKLHGEFARGQA